MFTKEKWDKYLTIKNELGFEPTYNILEDLEELLTLYTK